ncbi:NfeD family protein [Timonella sp. A28]|uniref:NfeD family protein n=1 Tax=Timonella sp. A28 TaxID=3442640 RepID=UPI003EBA6D62
MFTFILIGSIGLVLLSFSMLLGEIFDFADGIFSGTTLGAGLTVFGAVGVITTSAELPLHWTFILSGLAGICVLAIVHLLIKRLKNSDDTAPRIIVGLQGIATTDISASHGEVSLDDPNELERRLAWAHHPITEGTRIVVISHAGSRVCVEPVSSTAPHTPAE